MKLKYPRTYHFEWSEGKGSDDKTQFDLSGFVGREIIITEKMDGENTTLMRDCIYARSLDSVDHPSRHWVKGLWGNIKHEVPENMRVCGENLYAQHALRYENLPSYFMVFSIWEEGKCLSWKETKEYCEMLGLITVPVLWEGVFDLNFVKQFKIDTGKQEGFVMRLAESFSLDNFQKSVVKWVREGHVADDEEHWMTKKITPNKLIK